jgi:hypothetical protein
MPSIFLILGLWLSNPHAIEYSESRVGK